jgi:hypothetical protein
MRKLIAVGVLVGGLLAGAGSAMAQPLAGQGGVGDPLTLAASGVLIPYITGGAGGTVALIEVASPVAANPNLHMLFYNTTCDRVGDSVGLPETENDIAFQDVGSVLPAGTSGLVAIAGADLSGFVLVPLTAPIHSRVYEFNPLDGRSRVLEPVIVDTAEFGVPSGNNSHIWSPLRTAATFYAPLETATVNTQLTLVCPRTTIQGATDAAFGSGAGPFSTTGFPVIAPPFMVTPSSVDMRARIYDTNENLLRDSRWGCDCLTPDYSVLNISNVYEDTTVAAAGTYTELEVRSTTVGTFTGYRAVFSVGSPLNNFFGRLSNGSRPSIQGPLPVDAR